VSEAASEALPLARWMTEHEEELVAIRRHLHAHPEVSGEEHATTEFIAERLEVAGLRPRIVRSGTGLICDVGRSGGPLIALRGDIDGLPIADEKDQVHYRSQNAGVAHACGHDVHSTVVLGAGLFLAHQWPEDAPGLRLIFQPAEERVPGGALDVIDDGGLDGVEAIYGVHCDPKLDVGLIGLRAGPITSAADMVEIELSGPGGHTARPELTIDTVSLAAAVISQLPGRVEARVGTETPIKVVFGAVHAGEAANVIPTHALLRASVRTPSLDVWETLSDVVPAETRAIAATVGAHCEVRYTHGVPPVSNDDVAVGRVREAAHAVLGPATTTEAVQSWGGDDFAWYLREVPGCYIRLGTHDPDDHGPRLDLHAGHFDVDERAIGVGVAVLAATVQGHLAAP